MTRLLRGRSGSRRTLLTAAVVAVALATAGCGSGADSASGGATLSDPQQIRAALTEWGDALGDGDPEACKLTAADDRDELAAELASQLSEDTRPTTGCEDAVRQIGEMLAAFGSRDPRQICEFTLSGLRADLKLTERECIEGLTSQPDALDELVSGVAELDSHLSSLGTRLRDVRVAGDEAEGRITSDEGTQPVEFVRIDGRWLVRTTKLGGLD